jgi:hypothetical protein
VKLSNCGGNISPESQHEAVNCTCQPKQLFGNELRQEEATGAGRAIFFALGAIFRLHYGTMHIKLCSGIRRLK